MLYHVDEDGFHVELSVPDAIVAGHITSWAERIILPEFPRDDPRSGVCRQVMTRVTSSSRSAAVSSLGGAPHMFTPSRLTIARKRRGLTMTRLAR